MKKMQYRHLVQYYETDQMGIVHHSNYIRWFEEARTDFLKKIGFGYKELEEKGVISPVLSVECEYKQMTHYDEEVIIESCVESFNGVKLFMAYTVTGAEDGVLRAQGRTSHCFLDANGRPIRLKKEQPEFYECLMKMCQAE